jgi:hypothetical protein
MWHVSHGDKNFGPFAEDKMLALIKAGKIPPTVYVWKDGMADWVVLRDSSLMKSSAAAPPVMAEVVATAAAANPFDFSKSATRGAQPVAGISVSPQPTARQLANPYFSDFQGGSAAAQPAAAVANPNYQLLPLQGRQMAVVITCVIAGLLSLVCAWFTFQQTNLLKRMASGAYNNNISRAFADAKASDDQFFVVFMSYLAASLIMSIAFLVWFYRAHVNARGMAQAKFTDTSGWAVGFFFIPIMNLFKPFVGMRDIWRGSFSSPGSYAAPASTMVTMWWAAWLVTNFLSRFFVLSFKSRDTTPNELITLNNISMIGSILMIVPIGLTVMLVINITKQQARKALQLRQGTTAAQPLYKKATPQIEFPQF